MKDIMIDFRNLWGGFMKEDNLITNTLRMRYNVVIEEKNPDIIFVQNTGDGKAESCTFGSDCIVVHWFVEALNRTGTPDYDKCDFSFTSCKHDDEKNIRIPLWQMYVDWFDNPYVEGRNQAFLVSPKILTAERKPEKKNKFCCVLTNNDLGLRKVIYPRAFQYWKDRGFEIESRGNFLRTHPSLGGDELTKHNYIQDFKFNMCFDNSEYPGWITEKLIHPLVQGVVPIYWGCNDVGEDFNTKAFVHARDFENDIQMYDKVIELAENTELLAEVQSQPIFTGNKIPSHATPEHLLSEIERVIL